MKFKSALLTQASGSIGGMTFGHNRGGMYTRARSIPTNPNSSRQQIVRAAMTGLVQAFNQVLSEAQRAAWKLYADNTPTTDTLGDPLVLTAQQAYIASNVPRMQLENSGLTDNGNGRVDDAPTVFNHGVAVDVITTPTLSGTNLSFTAEFGGAVTQGGFCQLYVGKPQSASRNYYKGPYQLAGIGEFSQTDTEVEISLTIGDATSYASSYVPTAGQKLPVRLINVGDDGRTSTAYEELALVA